MPDQSNTEQQDEPLPGAAEAPDPDTGADKGAGPIAEPGSGGSADDEAGNLGKA